MDGRKPLQPGSSTRTSAPSSARAKSIWRIGFIAGAAAGALVAHADAVQPTQPSTTVNRIAVCLLDHRNYYAIDANALDSGVHLYRVVDGSAQRITGTDADVFKDHWQTLALAIEGDRLTALLNGKLLFTAQDRTFRSDGQIALWTVEDNVTRFDQLVITALPWSEAPR